MTTGRNEPSRRPRARGIGLRLRRARTLARFGAAIAIASLAYYLWLLIQQGDPLPWGSLVYVVIVLAGAAAALASVGDPFRGRRLLMGSTIAFAIIGIIELLSIGALFLLAALFTAVAAAQTPSHPHGDEQR
jgi:hypothetical protein